MAAARSKKECGRVVRARSGPTFPPMPFRAWHFTHPLVENTREPATASCPELSAGCADVVPDHQVNSAAATTAHPTITRIGNPFCPRHATAVATPQDQGARSAAERGCDLEPGQPSLEICRGFANSAFALFPARSPWTFPVPYSRPFWQGSLEAERAAHEACACHSKDFDELDGFRESRVGRGLLGGDLTAPCLAGSEPRLIS